MAELQEVHGQRMEDDINIKEEFFFEDSSVEINVKQETQELVEIKEEPKREEWNDFEDDINVEKTVDVDKIVVKEEILAWNSFDESQAGPSKNNQSHKMKMDEPNPEDEKLKRKRELTNARVKNYRKRKRTESQLLNSSVQDDDAEKKEKEAEDAAERKKALGKERSRRYRERKRLNVLKSANDSQSEPPHKNPRVSKNQLTLDSQKAETSTFSATQELSVNKKDEPSEDFAFSVFSRSSATYSSYAKHSSAHVQFHKQFIQNEFGHSCKICDRLWFKDDLKNLNNNDLEFVRTFLPNIEHSTLVCFTCRASIQKKFIPKMAVYNGFKYPKIPDHLKNYPLDLVSERLISPRIPFIQIRRLHCQCRLGGQVINVPLEKNTMVNKLPRNINDDYCIYVNFKQKMVYKSSFLYSLINKRSIKEWLQYLVNTPLYRKYNISIKDQFFDSNHQDVSSEVEEVPFEESVSAQQQTLVWNDQQFIAPGENDLPMCLFDGHAEELSFPLIYLGQFRNFREGVTVTPFMMATSELRRSDRRGVTPHHLLYMAMKIMQKRVKDSLTAFKHIKRNSVTKEESENYIHNSIESNLLCSIPNSTWYWSQRKNDLFAMIRQFGKPTVSFTISSNEIGWLDLLQLLHKLTKVNITKEEISKLHYMKKSTLINEDAVTCAIFFNKLVNVLMNILQSKTCSPFRKYRICQYFKRIEFQHGSPQAHILAWVDNAPKDDEAIELVDALTSVSAEEASGNIKLQKHKHTFSCEKKCRFDAPFMPCRKTMILTPMKSTEEGFINFKKRYAQIRERLEYEDFEDIDTFYNCNNIKSDEEYFNIIKAGITTPKLFVKRKPSEKWNNPFNPFIFNIVQSSTEFQFITEEFSSYVVEINKTNGVSNLQRKIIETMNEHPEFDITDLSKNIVNHTEISSQEAAWYLLREPLSKMSVIIEYIPTVWPLERQRIRKSMKELSDDDLDVWKENWFDKYERRPENLKNITLAQFVSKYTENRKREFFIERLEPIIIRYRNYNMASELNEYKREIVTLHIPFRNEEEEILSDMKFLTIYDNNEDIILQRRREFECDIGIDKTI